MKTKSLTKVTLLSIFVLSVITAVTLNSCQKESIKPKKTTSTPTGLKSSSSHMMLGAQAIEDVNNLLFSGKTQKGLGPYDDGSNCITVTWDSTGPKPYSKTLVYTPGCVATDGNTRSGTIVLTYNDKDIRMVNNVVTVNFQNYAVNSEVFNGTMSVTNTGPNGSGNLVLVQVLDFNANFGDEVDTFSSTRNYEWLAGESSNPLADLQFSITGSPIRLSSSLGNYAIQSITSPLIKNSKTNGCNYYIAGTTHMVIYNATATDSSVVDVDYGNPGGCSGLKTVVQDGVTSQPHQ